LRSSSKHPYPHLNRSPQNSTIIIKPITHFLTNSNTKPLTLDGNNDPSTSQTLSQKWNSLSHTTQVGIAAGIAGAILIGLCAFIFFCIRQRRAGRKERALEEAAWEKNNAELMAYRSTMEKQYQQQRGTPLMNGAAGGRPGGRNSWVFGGQKGFQRF
jgi:beta-lactamase regulating signal transducer with metallopeptidase domain